MPTQSLRLAIATHVRLHVHMHLGDGVLSLARGPYLGSLLLTSLRDFDTPGTRMHAPLPLPYRIKSTPVLCCPEFTMNQATPGTSQPSPTPIARDASLLLCLPQIHPSPKHIGIYRYTRDCGSFSAEKHIDDFIHYSEHQVRTMETSNQYELARGEGTLP